MFLQSDFGFFVRWGKPRRIGRKEKRRGEEEDGKEKKACGEAHLAEVRAVATLRKLRRHTEGAAAARAVADGGGRVCGAHGVGGCLRLVCPDLNARLALGHRDRLYKCQLASRRKEEQRRAHLSVSKTGVLP